MPLSVQELVMNITGSIRMDKEVLISDGSGRLFTVSEKMKILRQGESDQFPDCEGLILVIEEEIPPVKG